MSSSFFFSRANRIWKKNLIFRFYFFSLYILNQYCNLEAIIIRTAFYHQNHVWPLRIFNFFGTATNLKHVLIRPEPGLNLEQTYRRSKSMLNDKKVIFYSFRTVKLISIIKKNYKKEHLTLKHFKSQKTFQFIFAFSKNQTLVMIEIHFSNFLSE